MKTNTTIVPAAAPVVTVAAPEGPRARAVLALARFEARELLQQILVLVFFLVYTAATAWRMFSGHPGWHELTGHEGMDDFPALQDADRATQSGAMLLGLAMFVCANRAARRSRRRGTEPYFATLVMEPWRRTLAHTLSVVPFALLTGLVVAVRFGWAALKPGAVGHGSFFELAVAPLTVLLCGVAGVLLARLIPSAFAAPLFTVALYVATMYFWVFADNVHWSRWLAPVVTEAGADPVPSALVGRPAAWHALYLTGLVVTLVCAALLRSGGRTARIKAVTAVALAATAAGIAGQSPDPSAALQPARVRLSDTPEQLESCTARGATTYCALPEWTGRTGAWARTTERVRSLAGGTATGRRLTVRQRVEARYGLDSDSSTDPLTTPDTVTVGTRWGGNRIPEYAVGLASVLVAGDEKAGAKVCDGRAVTIMWLVLGADPRPMTTLRDVRLDDSTEGGAYVLSPTSGLMMSAEQTNVVRELLNRPRPSVTAAVKAHWPELTAPGISTAQAARVLGVPAAAKGTGGEDSCGE
ncbi:ABC transporter permease [Streptomyces sp. NPDC020801]|uniref:ABC transporter permease n=1 Tax=unclassified Streptomyces TaxID=2593676 RepID=UPI00379541C5